MKVFILMICCSFFLQINYCVCQVDPKKNDNKGKRIEENKNSSKEKKISTDDDEISRGKNAEGAGINVLEATDNITIKFSSISYSNILEITENEGVSEDGKTPVHRQKVKLMIQNNHSVPMWYLMPASGEKNMPANGNFIADNDVDFPFLAKKYSQEQKYLTELVFIGSEGHSFRAFYLEAGASLLFRNYDLGIYEEGEYVPFWSVQKLQVNDRFLLNEWLPYSVMSTPDVVIKNTAGNTNVSWKSVYPDKELLKGKVNFIQAHGIIKYKIPVGSIR